MPVVSVKVAFPDTDGDTSDDSSLPVRPKAKKGSLSPKGKSETINAAINQTKGPKVSQDVQHPSETSKGKRKQQHKPKSELSIKQAPEVVDRLVEKLKTSAAQTISVNHDCSEDKVATPLLPPGLGLDEASSSATTQQPAISTITVFDATRVSFGPGFEVQSLMTGFESRDVVIKNIPSNTTSDAIKQLLERFGEVTNIQLPASHKEKTMNVKASFANHIDAGAAVFGLDGADVLGGDLDIVLASTSPGKAIIQDGDVCLEFPSPSKIAYAGYTTRAQAEAAMTAAAQSGMYAEIYEDVPNLGPVNVRYQGLDPLAEIKEIEKLGKTEGVMLGKYNYKRLEVALEQLYDKLESYGDLEGLDVLPPPYTRGVVRAWARFSNPKTAERVCAEMHFRPQRFIGNTRLSAHHQRTLFYTLPPSIFEALAFDIRYLRYCATRNIARCNILINGFRRADWSAPVTVKLVAEDRAVLGRLKASFEGLLKGDTIRENGSILWDPYFASPAGINFMNELQRQHSGVVINKDNRKRVLSLFGPPGRRQQVRNAILAKAKEMQSRTFKRFSLKGKVVGLFVSPEIAKLQQELGKENVILSLKDQTLTVRGNEDAFKVARLAIRNAQISQPSKKKHNDTTCPICLDDVTAPVRLECGHAWCKTCLHDYLAASVDTKAFPLTCLGDEARCSHRISLNIASEILSPSEMNDIVQASFLAHIHIHASEFHHCPTPDCPQVYRNAPKGTVLRCPSCLVRICTTCNREHHDGVCRYSETEDMKLFEEWTKGHDVKKCPGCKAPIERSAGCNHMTCLRCKTHICWVCTATFSSGDEVYDHMHATHGGIGL
ncbi:hypothetical protein BXZ70DRAFT_306416 [Cristinia sonorae]|uniref:RING-type domain-containing protein n=1 Tax=Cristinia sonorae TaxID=1940300 RepID=A0A8K0XNQ4_9AGAR|nr:hypothetical protein BXZ70DRAFT_306416 [Cristinia sonorae]